MQIGAVHTLACLGFCNMVQNPQNRKNLADFKGRIKIDLVRLSCQLFRDALAALESIDRVLADCLTLASTEGLCENRVKLFIQANS